MPRKRLDPIDCAMEAALEPGSFVSYRRPWHFVKARKLFLVAGREGEWRSLAVKVRTEHRRKRGFLSDLDAVVSQGSIPSAPSLMEKARERRERHFRPS